tara:strand:- start:7226 stop:7441 length:216 start_codon:yes stop_codon:yes gene_type:complete
MTSDKKIDILWKAINKQGRYIEQLEVIVACLKKDSHPPVFKETEYKELIQRLELVEAWIDNIELIDKGELN